MDIEKCKNCVNYVQHYHYNKSFGMMTVNCWHCKKYSAKKVDLLKDCTNYAVNNNKKQADNISIITQLIRMNSVLEHYIDVVKELNGKLSTK